MQYWPSKTSGVAYDAGLNWAPALSQLGDLEIVDSAWDVLQGSCVLSVDAYTATTTSVRVSGGVADEEFMARNIVTLSDGQKFTEDVFLKILS